MQTFNPNTKTFDELIVVSKTELKQHNPIDLLKQEISGEYCPENIGSIVESEHSKKFGSNITYIPIHIYPDSCVRAENLLRGVLKFVEKYKLTIVGSYYLNHKDTSFGIRVDEFGKRG